MNGDHIERALGLRPLAEIKEESEEIVDVNNDQPLPPSTIVSAVEISVNDSVINDENLQDIEKARQNIEQIVELGRESLHEIISLAKQSESPRAFEVASTLMKTLLDANKEYVEMSTRKKYAKEEILNPKKEEEAAANVTNNNLILTTTDLLKMLKGEA
jgi:hypothetical protein